MNGSNWMKNVPGATSFAKITVPGTHDTMTWKGTSAPLDMSRTQKRSLKSQLKAGVRFLDIRLAHKAESLVPQQVVAAAYALLGDVGLPDIGAPQSQEPKVVFVLTHGKDDIEDASGRPKTFTKHVVDVCANFLQSNPSEAILMSIKRDDGDARSFGTDLEERIRGFGGLFHVADQLPALDSVRGKIVLIRRYNGKLGIDASGSRWPNNGDGVSYAGSGRQVTLAIQDHYKENDTKKKWPLVEKYMKKISANRLVLNFASIAFTFPHDPEYYAEKMNPRVASYLLAKKSPASYGVVIVDYVSNELAASIWSRNFKAAVNPSKLKVTFYEDDAGWKGGGDLVRLGVGRYDNKGKNGLKTLPQGWNDEIRAVSVPGGLSVYMTDRDSFRSGGKGTVRIDGPRRVNIKAVADNSGLAGKVSSVQVYVT